MNCILCDQPIVMKDRIRPNVATFECGHHFHLSCVLHHSRDKLTTDCFKCKPVKTTSFPNLSHDRILAMETLIQARQNKAKTTKGWFGFSSSSLKGMVSSGSSLNSIALKGYTPEDFIEESITWKQMSRVYTADALMDFGFQWNHLIMMGFEPKDFKKIPWHHIKDTLNLSASDILQTSINLRELGNLELELYQLEELGFTWSDFVKMGGNSRSLKLLTDSVDDLITYFNPSKEQLFQAGFTEEKVIKEKWKSEVKIKTVKVNGFVF